MTPLRATFVLLLLTTAVLAAGCAGPAERVPPVTLLQATVTPAPAIPTSAMVTPAGTSCAIPGNTSGWIRIDPIRSVEQGGSLVITGTTGFPAGKILKFTMSESAYHPHAKCMWDDMVAAELRVHQGDSCGNTFSLPIDSANYASQDYFVTIADPADESVTTYAEFSLRKNTTPLSPPKTIAPVGIPAGSLFVLVQPVDVLQGDVQTIEGIRKGTPFAIIYSVRDGTHDADCSPLLPSCNGTRMFSVIHPAQYGPDADRFVISFGTDAFEPGRYVVDFDATCTGADARVWFNVMENTTGRIP